MEEIWLFPINFKSDINDVVILEENRLKLRRMIKEEIHAIFGIEVTERYENGLIKTVRVKEGQGLNLVTNPLDATLINHKVFVMSSQFILEAKDVKCVEWFQQALKLHKSGELEPSLV